MQYFLVLFETTLPHESMITNRAYKFFHIISALFALMALQLPFVGEIFVACIALRFVELNRYRFDRMQLHVIDDVHRASE